MLHDLAINDDDFVVLKRAAEDREVWRPTAASLYWTKFRSYERQQKTTDDEAIINGI